jgi:hypothetical protein
LLFSSLSNGLLSFFGRLDAENPEGAPSGFSGEKREEGGTPSSADSSGQVFMSALLPTVRIVCTGTLNALRSTQADADSGCCQRQ